MDINIGELNKKIQIIVKTGTRDESGFETYTDIIVLKTWAKVSNTSGTEQIKSGADFSIVNTRFLIRTPKTAITNDMVIKFRNEKYEIIYINDYEYNKEFTEIVTKKVVI